MNRIEQYAEQIQDLVTPFLRSKNTSVVLQLHGQSGMQKTELAKYYAQKHGALYYSFRYLDANIAPKIFLPGCNNWDDFFSHLRTTKNRPVIFFDNMDDRDDKDDFICALQEYLRTPAFVIFISHKEMDLPFPSEEIEMKPMTVHQILEYYPGMAPIDALRLCAMTDGIPALVSQYNATLTFEENVRNFYSADSAYLRFPQERLRESFRSPESYNTLLYAMATGYNRISQIASFSGFPKNKCDKYIKALDAAGFIEQRVQPDGTGRMRTHYFPRGCYLKVWYQFCLPNQQNCVDGDLLQSVLTHIETVSTLELFRMACCHWLALHNDAIYPTLLRLNDPALCAVKIEDLPFDFVQADGDRMIFVSIWKDVGASFPIEMFAKIDRVTSKRNPFYNNAYVLFSVKSFSRQMEALKEKYDNIHLIDLKSMLGKKNADIFLLD